MSVGSGNSGIGACTTVKIRTCVSSGQRRAAHSVTAAWLCGEPSIASNTFILFPVAVARSSSQSDITTDQETGKYRSGMDVPNCGQRVNPRGERVAGDSKRNHRRLEMNAAGALATTMESVGFHEHKA